VLATSPATFDPSFIELNGKGMMGLEIFQSGAPPATLSEVKHPNHPKQV